MCTIKNDNAPGKVALHCRIDVKINSNFAKI
jgi:hypothetical protein